MRIVDTRRFRSKDGKSFHTFVVVEANCLEQPGLLGVLQVVEKEGDPPMELSVHDKDDLDAIVEKHKEDWVELTERKMTLAQEVLDSLRPDAPAPRSTRTLLDSAATSFKKPPRTP